MDEHEENFKDIFRYTDVEYTPDGYTDVYRWDDFLVIAGDHVYSAMDTIDSVSPGGKYEGFDPQYAYTCEIVGCGDLFDGCALFRPVSHDGEDYIQIAFLRSDIDDSTGEYTERFEAGSFDMPAADALRFDLAVDLMDYFSGRTFEGEPGVSRGLEPREAVAVDSPERYAAGDPDWSWMDMAVDSTVDVTFPDDMALKDWIASETTATGAAWARCFNRYCGPDAETCSVKEITAALRRFESPSYLVRGPIEDIESLPVGYYWCPDAVDPDPSYNGYLLNVFAAFGGDGLPGKFFELFGGVTLNDVPSFGFDDGWDGSCLNRLDWFEDAVGMDPDGLSAGLVANDIESVKALVVNCPAWIECAPSYSEKAARGIDDVVQAVKAYRANAKRVDRKVIPGRIPERLFEGARAAAANTAGGADGGTGLHI